MLFFGFSGTFPVELMAVVQSLVCIPGPRMLVDPGLQIKVNFFTRLNILTG